ncbi:hypothetical protein, partial [Pseudomonas aeruginosa]
GIDDHRTFEADAFVQALFAESENARSASSRSTNALPTAA